MKKTSTILSALFILMSSSIMAQNIPSDLTINEPTTATVEKIDPILKRFDQALMKKDVALLNQMLHDSLVMIHSNGLVETKEILLHNLESEHIIYSEIRKGENISISQVGEEKITVKRDLQVKGFLEGKAFDVPLATKENWVNVEGQWKLAQRESHKKN